MIEHIHYKAIEKTLFTQALFFNNKKAIECIEFINSQEKLKKFFNLSKIISTVFDFIPRSNISSIPLHINYNPRYDHVPYDINFNKTLEELMDNRANELKTIIKTTNKKLGIMWSGGIDSTAIIVAILRNFSKQELDYIEIYLNETSIFENVLFFANVIESNFKVINCRDENHNVKYSDKDEDFIVVDGEPADLIFGSDFYINKFLKNNNFSKIYAPWKNNFELILQCFKINADEHEFDIETDYIRWFVDQQIQNMSLVDIPVETTMDFFWWINFDNRWAVRCIQKNIGYINKHIFNQNSKFNVQHYLSTCSNTIHFFETNEFQKWAATQRKIECVSFNTIYDYKMPLKNYIYSYTKDRFYKQFKTKVNSNSQGVLYTYQTNFLFEVDRCDFKYYNTTNLDGVLNSLQRNIN